MVEFRRVCGVLLLGLATFARAEGPAELDALKARRAGAQATIHAEYLTSVTKLQEELIKALDALAISQASKGDLDGVIVAKQQRELVMKKGVIDYVSSETPAGPIDSLVRQGKAALLQIGKEESLKNAKLNESYIAQLKLMVSMLTQKLLIDDALKARQEIETVQSNAPTMVVKEEITSNAPPASPTSIPAASAPRVGARTPAYQKNSIKVLSAKHQIERFVDEMKKLNPDWDGKVKEVIEKNEVVELSFCSDAVTDITPIQNLPKVRALRCDGTYREGKYHGILSDLSPLASLQLERLQCTQNPRLGDLSPLKGQRLVRLNVMGCYAVKDLGPLQGMPLAHLDIGNTGVTRITPLQGMPLTYFRCWNTKVGDLSPLSKAPLTFLDCSSSQVATDLSPVRTCPLKELKCVFVPARDTEIVRSIKTLKEINDVPVKEFWKRVSANDVPKSN